MEIALIPMANLKWATLNITIKAAQSTNITKQDSIIVNMNQGQRCQRLHFMNNSIPSKYRSSLAAWAPFGLINN